EHADRERVAPERDGQGRRGGGERDQRAGGGDGEDGDHERESRGRVDGGAVHSEPSSQITYCVRPTTLSRLADRVERSPSIGSPGRAQSTAPGSCHGGALPAIRAVVFDFFGTLTRAVRRGPGHLETARILGCDPAAMI